jgi:phosphoribosylformimino-5-aminoimidazole carboxamide ribotide isomerase
MEIIPAIDIIEGKCVRLRQGDYSQKKIYNENPVEVARQYEDAGLSRLHLVDLDGAKAKKIVNYKIIEQIATKTSLIIDFGGGLKSADDLRIAFESGASMVTGGSIAVKNKAEFLNWIDTYGPEKIILGADVKEKKIAVSGWTETTDTDIIPFVKEYVNHGIQQVICTDISKDGMLKGLSFELYNEMMESVQGVKLIASGGVKDMHDVEQSKSHGLFGVIIGKALYEGTISLKELARFNRA